ncbi:uncharacterized protein SPPG_02842 [Spizellomyces punctatus DAOM BR117]|uniref:RING-type E3 ubiquitin transferase n=1 Tax=Spizellomyces punctatus (strain DAOM BR117) TaxID=645134 RepID=A0A0L0HMP4_SPIPD|nr:uncharacterized protein SPPG_02842 [Spizellomyces punctatus DAOM BR117]KND02372.1 hypothetical protein SPPG_02842 [Spizellomyces punctatus DAOM BR117]|eukprot:XP_016610411.1 hypothetical protein SPPG_02842 [Spizellomyces punctatus DAOM BR117]
MTSANSGNRKGKGNKKKFVPLSEFNPTQAVSHSAPPSAILPPGLMPAVAPAVVNGNAVATTQGAAREEEELCFICADAVTWYAVGECNHRVCHLCSLRLRALYKQRTCALCKTELAEVVYTKDGDTVFQDFDLRAMPAHDKKLKIYFDEPEIYEDVMILLRFNCPDPGCDVACAGGWRELKDHVRKAHGMLMCELCTRHKKLFTHEHTLYTRATLDRHNKLGDPDDPSFKGHPQCGFCKIHFYSQDELYEHCREKHEQCFLCQRNGIRNQYYQNYAEMEVHFQNDHFPCYHPECLEKKFVVFDSDIDLKAHELEVHRDQKARAKGQQIEVNFTYASRGWDSDHGRRSSRRDKRGGRSDGRADGRPSDGPNRRNGGESRGSADASVPPQPILLPQAVPAPAPAPSDGVRRLRPPPGFGSQLSDAEPATQGRSRSDSASPPISPATIDRQHPRSAHVKAHPTPAEAASGVSKTNGISSGIDSASNADPELTAKLQTLFNSDVSKLGEQGHLSADEFLEAS